MEVQACPEPHTQLSDIVEDAKDFYINVISPYKASLEIWYIENKSFLLNLKIILATILAVIYPNWDAADFFRTAPKISDKMIKSKLIK